MERNGGRVGSKHGPSKVRKLMKRIGTVVNLEYNTDVTELKLADAGDAHALDAENVTLEDAHELLTKGVKSIIQEHQAIPFVIGGGNDQSFPNALALLESVKYVLKQNKIYKFFRVIILRKTVTRAK